MSFAKHLRENIALQSIPPRPFVPFLPVEMHGNLEELAEKDENPDADDAEEARLERVVSLVAVLKTCGNFE